MLTKLFDKDHPILWFAWPLIVVALWIPSFFIENLLQSSNYGLISLFISWISINNWLPVIVTIIIVLFEGFLLKFITAKHDLLRSNNFYIPLIFTLSVSLFQFKIILNPFLLITPILTLAFDRLLELGKESKKFTVFEASLLIGLASILYYPCIYFILLCWVALFLFKSFDLREWIHPIIGLLAPLLISAAISFLLDTLSLDFNNYINNVFSIDSFLTENVSVESNISRLWIAITIVLSSNAYFNFLRSNIMRKKYGHLFFVWIVFIALLTSIFSSFTMTSFFIASAMLTSTFFGTMATNTHRKWVADFIIFSALILIGLNTLFQFGYL